MKIKLILKPDDYTSFMGFYLEPVWHKYFDIEPYDSGRSYDRKQTAFVVNWTSADTSWPQRMREQGYCVIVDNLWEVATNRTDYFWLENPMWFWYNESLWWTALGYDQYSPNRQIQYSAFMPIGRVKDERDYIVEKLGSLKENMIWSYKNQTLPGDIQDTNHKQRYLNPEWYNSTYSSLVVETGQLGPLFVTEKTFKPIGYYHPFQVIAMPGILATIKEQGFETYSNLFDESYDTVKDFDSRLAIIINNLKEIKFQDYDRLTKEKLEHNHNRFFDTQLVTERIVTEIINPIIEHVQTRN